MAKAGRKGGKAPDLKGAPAAVRVDPKAAKLRMASVCDAREAIGTLEPGARVVGLTKGQFSMLDLVRAALEQTGPADVQLTTWTVAIRDAETAGYLLHGSGAIRSLQLITDRSFPGRQPGYCDRIRDLFGDDAIRMTNIHAKIALIRNESWNLCIRGSMNLTRNPRWEQFDLDDDPAICDHFDRLFQETMEVAPPGLDPQASRKVTGLFRKALDSADNGEGMPKRVTGAELARQLGVSTTTVYAAVKAGRISRDDDGLFDPDESSAAFADRLSEGAPVGRGPGRPSKAVTDEEQSIIDRQERAKLRKLEAEAEKKEIEAAQLRGTLIDIEKMARVHYDSYRRTRDAMLGIPDNRAEWLASEDDAHEIRTTLRSDIEKALTQVANEIEAEEDDE